MPQIAIRIPVAILLFFLCVTGAAITLQSAAFAHPADEFCAEDRDMDPALCRALAEMDAEAEYEDASKLVIDRSRSQTAKLYLGLGFTHILPKGADHILFVLALFFASTKLRPLLWQISAFTLAHTLTLALAASGRLSVPADIVEPLIAISIAWVAVENLFFRDTYKWRPAIVFGFGLFHGIGFAGVLADLGLPQDQFLTSLISFNIGVELGQLTVISACWFVLQPLFTKPWYRQAIPVPASLLIAATGLFWALQRVFL